MMRRQVGRRWLSLLGCWLSGILVMTTASLSADDAPHAARVLLEAERVLVIAHRGDSGAWPENTLPAFRAALEARADLVELDYHHSAEGVPVVLHDETLDRTTNAPRLLGAKRKVSALPLEDLRKLDAGAWFGPRFAGTALPTLEEALEVIQSGSVTLIERKGGDAATCAALLRRRGLTRDVVVQAFDWKYVAEMHRHAPETMLAALGSKGLTPEKLEQIAATGARVVAWKGADLDPAAIRAAKARGFKVWAYTINQQKEAERLLAAGIDGIITDYPAAMRRWVEAAAEPAAP